MAMTFEEKAEELTLWALRLHRGEDDRISRYNLLSHVRDLIPSFYEGFLSDRLLRKCIERLRVTEEGCMICASLRGGYFLARDKKELEKFTGSDHRRAIKTLTRVRKQRKAAGLLVSPQMEMEI